MSVVEIEWDNEPALLILLHDITSRKLDEEKIKKLNRIYEVLSSINKAIVYVKDLQELFNEVCRITVEIAKYNMVWIGLIDQNENAVKPAAWKGEYSEYIKDLKIPVGKNRVELDPIQKVVLENRSVVFNDIENEISSKFCCSDSLREKVKSVACFPIHNDVGIIGVITFFSQNKNYFDDKEIKLLDELSSDISFSIRSIQHEQLREIAEKALQKNEKQLRQILENVDAVFYIVSPDKRKIIYVSSAYERIWERPVEVLLKDPNFWLEAVLIEDRHLAENLFEKCIGEAEYRIAFPDGRIKWISDKMFPVYDDNNEINLLCGMASDITLHKKAEDDLIKAKEKAEEMNRLKSNFLANMSHELRTPMIGIMGFSDTLMQELENPEQIEMASTIHSSGKRLLNTLNLLLDLSKIETNPDNIKKQKINIGSIVKEISKTYTILAQSKELSFNISILDENISAEIDIRLFTQVIDNLLNNAFKFTNKGGITIQVNSEIVDEISWVVIKVIDSGIGIPKNSLQIIFEEFRQVSEGFNRTYEGTGLGLTVTKKFVELMDGIISVESEIEVGSTFIVRFKAAGSSKKINEREETKIELKKNIPFVNSKILIVENDKVSIDFLRMILKKYYKVDVASNGQTAINLASENIYSLIFMDIGLGFGMNGIEAAEEIRKIKNYEKTPIIAVTAFAMKSDEELFLSSGCSYYLSKPYTRKNVMDLLADIMVTI